MTMICNVIQFRSAAAPGNLRRPRLLAQAARAGLGAYQRRRDLPRILKCEDLPDDRVILQRLRSEEAELNAARIEAQADYDLQRHILILIAILAEFRMAAPVPVTCPGTAIQAHP
ncbi:DUF6477 family protein [Paracoccus sp. CPCC 101403]|uniref:DUF6477 family protein n=1 Tax=Paracoccus broussonetiae TaxID=3075834 RepID=A0ABU3EHP9_9RHOB|nr:DUF6477 family protein [Paracoccus sp. CPCC 101403]MDT1063776.1 DUF6477 family protein [Paracoccus sp. CPCC 101403]